MRLNVSAGTRVSASTASDASTLQISLAAAELADSESELVFLIGHKFGHVIQIRTGRNLYSSDFEADAASVGLRLAVGGGYDPYAAVGLFGKLQMASTEPGVLGNILWDPHVDPHTSFAGRIDRLISTLRSICGTSSEVAQSCESYKSLVHPRAPAPLPLGVRPQGKIR